MTKWEFFLIKKNTLEDLGRKSNDMDERELILECINDTRGALAGMTVEEAESNI